GARQPIRLTIPRTALRDISNACLEQEATGQRCRPRGLDDFVEVVQRGRGFRRYQRRDAKCAMARGVVVVIGGELVARGGLPRHSLGQAHADVIADSRPSQVRRVCAPVGRQVLVQTRYVAVGACPAETRIRPDPVAHNRAAEGGIHQPELFRLVRFPDADRSQFIGDVAGRELRAREVGEEDALRRVPALAWNHVHADAAGFRLGRAGAQLERVLLDAAILEHDAARVADRCGALDAHPVYLQPHVVGPPAMDAQHIVRLACLASDVYRAIPRYTGNELTELLKLLRRGKGVDRITGQHGGLPYVLDIHDGAGAGHRDGLGQLAD